MPAAGTRENRGGEPGRTIRGRWAGGHRKSKIYVLLFCAGAGFVFKCADYVNHALINRTLSLTVPIFIVFIVYLPLHVFNKVIFAYMCYKVKLSKADYTHSIFDPPREIKIHAVL